MTDAGLAHLTGLTGLTYLNLNGTRVTAAGLTELQKSLGAAVIVSGPRPRRAVPPVVRK